MKIRYCILQIIGILFCFGACAQTLDLNKPLPVNKEIKKGVLPNGMTYYIYKTDVTKNAASYYLVQNVGSILENDDQRGLAHFLEHMAFNGTEHFKGKGIIEILQKNGLTFGKDINAYTSYDETVYNISNLPNTPKLIDTGLLILKDWTNYLSLTDEEIDAERGVIKEEWRTVNNGDLRILKQTMGAFFNYSKYKDRLPIGLMEIIDNFKYKTLRDFYHDWYRTDLQAIIIVGDIDIDQMEKKIVKTFSGIPAVENPKERYTVKIPKNDEFIYAIGMDEEVSTPIIDFMIRHPHSIHIKDKTIKYLKTSLIQNLINNLFLERLNIILTSRNTPFLRAGIAYSKEISTSKVFSVSVSPKLNKQHEAFERIMNEVNSAVKFGFTSNEIERAIIAMKSDYRKKIAEKDDVDHISIVLKIKDNYLENEPLINIEQEFKIVKKILATLNENELNQSLKRMYIPNNRSVIVTGVKGNNNLTREDAIAIIEKAENNKSLVPYVDTTFKGKTIIDGLDIKRGKIEDESINNPVGATTFVLSNGIKVHYKFSNKSKNSVDLMAISYGGKSLIDDTYLPSVSVFEKVMYISGFGEYSDTDISKMLVGKDVFSIAGISDLEESIEGYSVTEDIETLLQTIYLRFTKPRFDKNSYDVVMDGYSNFISEKKKALTGIMKDSIKVTLYGKNNPRQRLVNESYAEEISFEKIKTIYSERFGNAADFEFFITGDVQKEKLKPLLEKYIASIPTNNIKESWKNKSTPLINKKIKKEIYLKMETPKNSVRIAYKNKIEHSIKNTLLAKTLEKLLRQRYLETLREKEGGTYGAQVQVDFKKRPMEEVTLEVVFDCNPDKVDILIPIVYKEVQKIANGDIKQLDVSNITKNYLKDRKHEQDRNQYDQDLLINYFREGYNMNDPKNFEDIINGITVKDIQKFTKKLLSDSETYEIVFKPKQ